MFERSPYRSFIIISIEAVAKTIHDSLQRFRAHSRYLRGKKCTNSFPGRIGKKRESYVERYYGHGIVNIDVTHTTYKRL